jgi:hypothetical protein
MFWLTFVLRFVPAVLKSRHDLLLENLALRHQLLLLTHDCPVEFELTGI